MTYNEMWRTLASTYGENEAKAVVRVLLDDLFGISLTDILCGCVEKLTQPEKTQLSKAMERLQNGEPVQYVTGKAQFCGHTFHAEPGVLIPRPETEMLCNTTIKKCTNHEANILDVGTGSGCIACTIALNMPKSTVTAWDISEKALDIASKNAKDLGAKVTFCRQDALNPPADHAIWDAIVSNPPYICIKEKEDMERIVLEHEPHQALFVPDDHPLLFYSAIAEYATTALKNGGWLLFEINSFYASSIEEMLNQKGFIEIETHKDIFGKARMTIARKP